MTDVQAWLDQGRTLADQAAEGPWEVEESSDGWTEIYGRDSIEPITPTVATTERGGENEAAFIADARTRLPQALAALQAVIEVHTPIDALNMRYRGGRVQQVCTGCGTDDGNWNRWPCPTVRAIQAAIGDKQ